MLRGERELASEKERIWYFMKRENEFVFDLQLFALNTNATTDTAATTGNELSDEMKTYYSDYLIDNAAPRLIHDQFGQKHPIPKNGGKTIEFRKYNPLPKLTVPIQEGVTPNGQKLSVSKVTAKVDQYGGYVALSDVLLLSAIDNNMVQATKLLGAQSGATLDTITREVLNGGSSVQYGDSKTVNARYLLTGGEASGNNYLTVRAVKMAARYLKTQNAQKIGDSYVAIIHPDIAFDLTDDPEWKEPHTYCDTKELYEGEIGKIGGVRFVETTEAKIFHADNLSGTSRNLTLSSVSGSVVTISETLTASDKAAIIGRKVLIGAAQFTVTAAADNSVTLNAAPTVTTAGTVIYPGEAGAKGRDVYSVLVIAENAYGVTEIQGGGLEHIVKQLGSGGTEDPLNQRATVGWKATKVAERLVESYMRRIEVASTFESGSN